MIAVQKRSRSVTPKSFRYNNLLHRYREAVVGACLASANTFRSLRLGSFRARSSGPIWSPARPNRRHCPCGRSSLS